MTKILQYKNFIYTSIYEFCKKDFEFNISYNFHLFCKTGFEINISYNFYLIVMRSKICTCIFNCEFCKTSGLCCY